MSAVSLAGDRAVVRVRSTYQPAGGPGSKVFPPTYPSRDGKQPYVVEHRVVDGQDRLDVLLDSAASQANRAEEALLRAHRQGLVRVPLIKGCVSCGAGGRPGLPRARGRLEYPEAPDTRPGGCGESASRPERRL